MALPSVHRVAEDQGTDTEHDGRTSTKHQNKASEQIIRKENKLLNANQTVYKCFKVFRIGKISIDSVTFVEQFLCRWHCA